MRLRKTENRPSLIPLLISIISILLLVLLFFLNPTFNNFITEAYHVLVSDDADRINSWVQQFGLWGPIVIVLAMIVQLIFAFIPGVIIMVISILAYGPWLGSLIAMFGIVVSSTVGYIIGDYFGDLTVQRLVGEKSSEKIKEFVESYGIWTIIVVRMSPFLSHDLVSLIGGVVDMTYRRFITATIIGSFPLLLLIALFGTSLEALKPALIIGTIISIIVFVLYIILDKRRKRRRRLAQIKN
ncbi:TVP38/TMEM64 family protein [Pseudoxanthomonas sp. SGD-10]|nr:TVP38/TMEM64 family protein [Pseudoxanthomonas sp. SGD-10]